MTEPESVPTTTGVWTQTEAVPRDSLTKLASIEKAIHFEAKKAIPELGPQQLLIKVARCTINPNELLHLSDVYGPTEDLGFPRPAAGFEGSGTVIKSTASFYLPQAGQRVAFYADQGGAHGEYLIIKADSAIPIDDSVSFERGAASVTNPITAVCMVDYVASKGHKVFVNTAAASALGKLLIKYAATKGVDVINIVRKEEQIEMLKSVVGAKYVLNMTKESFSKDLKALMKETNCTFIYDCIGGTMPTTLLNASPPNTTISIYGALVSDDAIINSKLLMKGHKVEGFIVAQYMKSLWIWSILSLISKVKKMMTEDTPVKIRKVYKLEETPQAFIDAAGPNMSDGKVQTMGIDGE